jgi:hypothetical protein
MSKTAALMKIKLHGLLTLGLPRRRQHPKQAGEIERDQDRYEEALFCWTCFRRRDHGAFWFRCGLGSEPGMVRLPPLGGSG